MPMICYEATNFKAPALTTIQQANDIIQEYSNQGFDLTLRQLFYQFVSRDLLANNLRSYKNLGMVVNKARMSGLIDWDHITDRTRNVREVGTWSSPHRIVEACASQFKLDLWKDQPIRVEVWIEKDALVGVIQGVCNELRVPHFSCRGYTSQSEMWAAGRRLREHLQAGKRVKVFHLGDHDPSGIDMTRDIRDRLRLFAEAPVEVARLALNMNQVEEYGPPPNPAKDTDSRSESYNDEFGDESWELDALEPAVLTELVRGAVEGVRDDALWEAAEAREREAQAQLQTVADNWAAVIEHLGA